MARARKTPVGAWARLVGERFNRAMTAKGWTQRRFAKEGVAASTVGDLVNARRSATLGTFESLCKTADLNPFDVINGAEEVRSFHDTSVVQGGTDKDGDLMNRPDAQTLVSLIPKLHDDDLEQLVFKAVELRKQRGSPPKAQPAPKEQVQRR